MGREDASREPDGGGAAGPFFSDDVTSPDLLAGVEAVSRSQITRALLESFEGILVIIDEERRVIAFNADLEGRFGVSSPETLLGLRLGEALRCSSSLRDNTKCGDSRSCRYCGFFKAVMECEKKQAAVGEEWLLTTGWGADSEAATLRVRATPIEIDKRRFIVVCLQDISDQKRRQMLEQVFFHDTLNTLTGISGWSQLLENEGRDPEFREAASQIALIASRLEREITAQRDLVRAEAGTLELKIERVKTSRIFEELGRLFDGYRVSKGRRLVIDRETEAGSLVTDETLLLRVLTNMVKNALEASGKGEEVRLWCEVAGPSVTFRVWNEGCIPQPVALMIFQRYFSTKGGEGRGLGTYSMKLFGERYLGGVVGFASTVEEGTTFSIQVPLDGPPLEPVIGD